MPAMVTTGLTAEQFAERYADEPLCELVRGEVLKLSPGAAHHSSGSGNAYYLISGWARRTRLGRAVANEAGLVTRRNPDTVRGADVAYFSYQRLPKGKLPSGFFTVPPELVVEVLGKGQGWNEMLAKAAEYFEMGVDRVWLIDPDKRSLHVLRAEHEPVRLTELDRVQDAAILPGFSCQVAEFFED